LTSGWADTGSDSYAKVDFPSFSDNSGLTPLFHGAGDRF
jgi:hypothetical protein